MQNQKIKSYIGFAVKAGDVVFGLDNILTSRRRVHCIVADKTLGDASRRKLTNYLKNSKAVLVVLDDVSLGSDILKRDRCKIIGVLNDSLASAIIKESK